MRVALQLWWLIPSGQVAYATLDRQLCRTRIFSHITGCTKILDYFSCNHKQSPLELWCRRLINDTIEEYYGKLYIDDEAEQALCYSNDIVNCCKMYYVSVGKARCMPDRRKSSAAVSNNISLQ